MRVVSDRKWLAGKLFGIDAATEAYNALKALGGASLDLTAFMELENAEQVKLSLFPIAPSKTAQVEYTVALPTEYYDGRHHLTLPRDAVHTFDAGKGARDLKVVQNDDAVSVSFAAKQDALGGALAVVPLASDSAYTRVRIEAGPTLSKVPDKAHVVVAMDTSRSLKKEQVDAQRDAAIAYLSHFTDATTHVLAFDRTVRTVRDIETAPLTRHNGSRVDKALLKVAALLKTTPADTPKRVLLLTDAITAESVTAGAVESLIRKTGALVHVASVSCPTCTPELAVADVHDWDDAVHDTGGLAWSAKGHPDDDTAYALFEEWARPIRIHELGIDVLHEQDDTTTLLEGDGTTVAWLSDYAYDEVVVFGKLWNKTIKKTFAPNKLEAKRASALVFGSELVDAMDYEEMSKLALSRGVLSQATGFLAAPKDAKPGKHGFQAQSDAIGLGSVGTTSGPCSGTGPAELSSFRHKKWLKNTLGLMWQSCGGDRKTGSAKIETTYAEIVDVLHVKKSGDDVRNVVPCMKKELWALKLPADFTRPHVTYEVEL